MRFHAKCVILFVTTISMLFFCIFKLFTALFNSREIFIMTSADPLTDDNWFHVKIEIDDQKPQHKGEGKKILLWTRFFGTVDYIPPLSSLGCEISNCIITSNRSHLEESDALIFHLRDMTLGDLPPLKYPWQRWILLNHESPPHTPDILRHLGGFFNWTATYRFDSDILLTPQVRKREHINFENINYAQNKTRMVAWFVSNCQTPSNREGFVKEMQKTIPVDIFGSCGSKMCLPKMSRECYLKVASEYRYYLSFENSLCKDYVTEKFYHVLGINIIPVVMGGVDYSKIAPPNSFIDVMSFRSPRQLSHFLLDVAKNEKKYNSYFNWKRTHEMHVNHYACEICKRLHSSRKASSYKDLHHWWFDDANCKMWTPQDLVKLQYPTPAPSDTY